MIDAFVRDHPDEVVLLADPAELVPALRSLRISARTIAVLVEVYAELRRHRDRASRLLHSVPRDPGGRLELRHVEGSGFYEQVGGVWLYHKGAGSVEAATYFEHHGVRAMYPGFGAEIPGAAATFSSSRLLGVKQLRQMVHECCMALMLLGDLVETHRLAAEEVIGRCAIPVAVALLPGVTRAIAQHLADKPHPVQAFYADLSGGRQAAICLLAVPGPARGTDEYSVEGKWEETHHVFARVRTLGPAVLHHWDVNPYWDAAQSEARGAGIRGMVSSGVAYQAFSAHLQNLYARPATVTSGPFSPVADGCDLLFLDELSVHERGRLILHNLAGWRGAESLGPSVLPCDELAPAQLVECSRAFFRGLMGSDAPEALAGAFLVAPEAVALAIARRLGETGAAPRWSTWRALVARFPHALDTVACLEEGARAHRGRDNRLLEAVAALVPVSLVDAIHAALQANGSLELDRLDRLGRALVDDASGATLAARALLAWRCAIEAAARCGESVATMALVGSPDDAIAATRAGWRTWLRDPAAGSSAELADLAEDAVEQAMHRGVVVVRRTICHHVARGDLGPVQRWLRAVAEPLAAAVEDPQAALESYLTFVFKRAGVSAALWDADHRSFEGCLEMIWSGGPSIVVRAYPRVRLTALAREALPADDDLVNSVSDLIVAFGFGPAPMCVPNTLRGER